jgi:UDP-N-acetylglucosamine:LPS N-acetylglucosamine transferase
VKRGGNALGRKRVLAISSGGGHWVQLCRVAPTFSGCDLHFATVDADHAVAVAPQPFHPIPDATRWDRWSLARLTWNVLVLVVRLRPDVVFTTGAAPGAVALVIGRILGARTIWLDSIANIEELSGSGRMVRRFADLWLTQWPHLAGPEGPEYAGAVL